MTAFIQRTRDVRAWAVTGVGLMAALLTSGPARGGEEASGWVDTFDNAAVDYWKARAIMRSPADAAEHALLAFLEDVLPSLEPQALALNPEAARWVLADRPMLATLQDAAGRSFCFFHPPSPGQALGDAVHYRAVAELTERALAVAAALEFVENEQAAAGAYADVLRMLDRLDEDLLWVSAYQHLSLLPTVVSAVEGFCSREPPRQALAPLADYLAGLDRPHFPQVSYLRKEQETYRNWLLEDSSQAEARLSNLYGRAALQPAIDKLTTLSPRDKVARLGAWFDEYQGKMARLAEFVELPHDQAVRAIKDMDKQVAGLAEDPSGEGVNPLIPLLMKPFSQTYEQFVAAEAVYTMLDIIVAATVQRDFTGDWPTSLENLETFVGRSFPIDPFSGKPHRYGIRGGLSSVTVKPPSWLKQQTRLPFDISLNDRVEQDVKNLQKHIKTIQAERMRAAIDLEKAAKEGVER